MSTHIRFNISPNIRNTNTILNKSTKAKPEKVVFTTQETKQPQENQNGGGSSAFVISNK